MTSSIMEDLSPTVDLEVTGDWVQVFGCRVCGQRWADEYPQSYLQGGGPRCRYAIDADDPRVWLAHGPGLPARLREDGEDRAFFDALGEERPSLDARSPAARMAPSR
jgi:hypothetical protein